VAAERLCRANGDLLGQSPMKNFAAQPQIRVTKLGEFSPFWAFLFTEVAPIFFELLFL
jgi:hypothetical protein